MSEFRSHILSHSEGATATAAEEIGKMTEEEQKAIVVRIIELIETAREGSDDLDYLVFTLAMVGFSEALSRTLQ